MPINISKDGTGFKIEPKHTNTSPGTAVSFTVAVKEGVQVCFSDPDIWNPPAKSFDLDQGNTSKMTSGVAKCTGFVATDKGVECPKVSGCIVKDDPATISTSSAAHGSEHGHHAPHHKKS